MLRKISLTFYLLLNLTCTLNATEEKNVFVHEIQRESELEAFLKQAKKPVVLDFWAPWCGACMRAKPVFESVAEDLQEECLFIAINVDEDPAIKNKYELLVLPTILIIKDGAIVGKYVGSMNKKRLKANIQNIINNKLTIESLVSAIQEGNQEKIALCLKEQRISVNESYETEIVGTSFSMTPLIGAIAKVIFWDGDANIVLMLLKAGAKIDLEIDTPIFDTAYEVTEWNKQSALSLIEESTKDRPDNELKELSEPALEFIIKSQKNAKNLLKLLQSNGYYHQKD